MMDRQRKDALSIRRQEETYAAFAAKGVGKYPTTRGVTLDGQMVNLDPLEASLLPIITTTCQYCGQTPGGRDVAFMAQEVAKSLRLRYGAMHLEEIKEACEIGRDGKEFGEVFGINAKTIMHWVSCYVDDGYHAIYMRKHMKTIPVTRQLAEKADAGIEKLAKANALETQFQKYQALKRGERLESDDPEGGIDLGAFTKIRRDGKPARSLFDPLWDHDGTGFDGAYARDLNALGWPGKDLKEIFDNLLAEGITHLKGQDGYLIRRASR